MCSATRRMAMLLTSCIEVREVARCHPCVMTPCFELMGTTCRMLLPSWWEATTLITVMFFHKEYNLVSFGSCCHRIRLNYIYYHFIYNATDVVGRHAALCDVYGTGAQLLPHHRAMQLMSSFMQVSATDDKRVLLQEARQSEEWSCSISKEDSTSAGKCY